MLLSTMSDTTYKSETLEHLGLVAEMFDELGIGELVDELVPQDLSQRKEFALVEGTIERYAELDLRTTVNFLLWVHKAMRRGDNETDQRWLPRPLIADDGVGPSFRYHRVYHPTGLLPPGFQQILGSQRHIYAPALLVEPFF
jgi:hypothetical protein